MPWVESTFTNISKKRACYARLIREQVNTELIRCCLCLAFSCETIATVLTALAPARIQSTASVLVFRAAFAIPLLAMYKVSLMKVMRGRWMSDQLWKLLVGPRRLPEHLS